MFKKLFGSKKNTQRGLDHPNDLQVGDMVSLQDSFLLPIQLRNQTLVVEKIHSYQYQYSMEYEFVLKGSDSQPIFMTVLTEDGIEQISFSIKIQRDTVDELFTLDQFANIFDSEEPITLITQHQIDVLQHWLGKEYIQQSAAIKGYFCPQDLRQKEFNEYEQGSEPFEVIELLSEEGRHGISIEIWEGGETDVALTLIRPLADINALYPGGA